jgi:hypothetical protein
MNIRQGRDAIHANTGARKILYSRPETASNHFEAVLADGDWVPCS